MNSPKRNTYGEIRDWSHDETATRFQWRIPNIVSVMDKEKQWILSPPVRCLGAMWKLSVHPDGRLLFILVYLHGETAASEFVSSVRFTLGFAGEDGTVEEVVRNQRFPEGDKFWGPGNVKLGRKKQSLTTRLPSSGELTIACSVWRYELPLAENITIFREHFKNLLLSGDHYDFLINVRDKQYWAHKCILQARSPVFAAMFRSDMAESAEGSVTIDDCDPDAFGEFLRFVYSGEVDISSTGHALGLYYAGDKYDFPRLKELCVEFLKMSLTAATVCDVMNFAVTRDEEELQQEAITYLSKNLEEIMLSAEWQRFLAHNPLQANEMCLKAVQCLKTSWHK